MNIFKGLAKKLGRKKKPVYIVSGLPRSGTSMMMKMLEAGGMEPLIDNIRVADEDNPKGYYEFERVKQLERDSQWLDQAGGKVVKIISMLLFHLPDRYAYRVIFMERQMAEILASQAAMLSRLGKTGGDLSDEALAGEFGRHLEKIKSWLGSRKNLKVLYVNYNEIFENPRVHISRIAGFLDLELREDKMAEIIDPSLYRQRK